jgi:hypothetical protein
MSVDKLYRLSETLKFRSNLHREHWRQQLSDTDCEGYGGCTVIYPTNGSIEDTRKMGIYKLRELGIGHYDCQCVERHLDRLLINPATAIIRLDVTGGIMTTSADHNSWTTDECVHIDVYAGDYFIGQERHRLFHFDKSCLLKMVKTLEKEGFKKENIKKVSTDLGGIYSKIKYDLWDVFGFETVD